MDSFLPRVYRKAGTRNAVIAVETVDAWEGFGDLIVDERRMEIITLRDA